MPPEVTSNPPPKGAAGLYTIIAIKSGKGLLLLALALGIFSLAGHDLDKEFDAFLRTVGLDPEKQFFAQLGNRLDQITPSNLRWVASGTLLYSVMLFVESVGLGRRSWWAGWLAIGETAFFLPIEIYELLKGFSYGVLLILIVNLAMVWYLVRNRARLFHHG